MMKYLVLLVVLLVAYLLWRNARLAERQAEPPPSARGAPGAPQEMVACSVCAVHLPRGEALPGARGRLYCCQEHRLRGETR